VAWSVESTEEFGEWIARADRVFDNHLEDLKGGA